MPDRPLVVLLLALASSCQPAPHAPAPAAKPRAVQLIRAQLASLPREVRAHGTLLALDELALGFQVPGRLAELQVDLGDRVTADQVLARLDQRDFALERERAAAELQQTAAQLGLRDAEQAVDLSAIASVREAEAVLAEATQAAERVRELVAKALRPQSDWDAAAAAQTVAQSRVQRAKDQARVWMAELSVRRQQLAIADKRLQDTAIKAPWAGRVSARHGAVGQYLTGGQTVLTLLRTHPLRLRCEVPERDAAAIQLGQRVAFAVDGMQEQFTATVVRLGSQIDRTTRTLLVEASADNAADRLLPGAFCRARIVVQEAEPAIMIPTTALASFAGVDRVFFATDGKAAERLVEVGRRNGEQVEIVRGLSENDSIVASPGDLVRGALVVVEGR